MALLSTEGNNTKKTGQGRRDKFKISWVKDAPLGGDVEKAVGLQVWTSGDTVLLRHPLLVSSQLDILPTSTTWTFPG